MFALFGALTLRYELQVTDRTCFIPASRQRVFQTWLCVFSSQSKFLEHPEESADCSHNIMFLSCIG
jgi:hypothetical protein